MSEPGESIALHRVGPNAVIQLGAALRERLGSGAERRAFHAAGLDRYLDRPPQAMLDEREAARLFRVILEAHSGDEAELLLRDAGRRTAEYVMRHRIPRLARTVLELSPPPISGRLLLSAIERNAWTFAGSGQVATGVAKHGFWIEIAANPLATPGCAWHQSVFERLFSALVSKDLRVSHPACRVAGARTCRFEVSRACAGHRR